MFRIIAILCVTAALAGCALTEDVVAVPYQPSSATLLSNAGAVSLSVVDGRTADRGRISTKINGYGMDMGAIRTAKEVPEIVRDALKTEFEQRGFRIESNQRLITVSVDRFYNSYETSLLSGTAKGDVQLTVTIADPAGAQLFSHLYAGTSEMTVMTFGGSNAADSVAAALKDAIVKMFADPAFVQAVTRPTDAKPMS